tara:strand:+ start:83 stop:220 length:138 start_codon:yes stop_codon:yes gene_type:complete
MGRSKECFTNLREYLSQKYDFKEEEVHWETLKPKKSNKEDKNEKV